MNSSIFSIKMHYGGVFSWDSLDVHYKEGKFQIIDFCKPPNLSFTNLIEIARQVGVETATIKSMYFRKFGVESRKRFVEILSDNDVFDLGKILDNDRVAEVYIEGYVVSDHLINDNSDDDPDYVAQDDDDDLRDDDFSDNESSDYFRTANDEALERFGGSDEELGVEDDVGGVFNHVVNVESRSAIQGLDNEEDIVNEGYALCDSLDSGNDTSCQEEVSKVKFTRADLNNVRLKVGMIFETSQHFRAAMRNYAIQEGKNIRPYRSTSTKIGWECVKGCNWRCFATRLRDEETFRITSMTDSHSCSRTGDNKNCTSKHIAEVFLDRIRNNQKWGLKEFRADVQSQLKCKISLNKANKAMRMAKKKIIASSTEQFGKLWDYIEELKKSNPGTTAIMKVIERAGTNGEPMFRCLYIGWGALKKGFLDGCRPVIGVDGCHLTGPSKGVLLTAVAIDANNCMYPFAYAVVDIENTKTWRWFLKRLRQDLQVVTAEYTFISDKQKGLINAMEEVLPGVEHRYCVRHLYNNFKVKHKGLLLKDLLWKAARATTESHFLKALAEVNAIDNGAYEWLKDKPGENWSKSHFRTLPKCDILLNNLCESFNSVIVEARSKCIIDMLEMIREYLMEMVAKKKTAMLRWNGVLCPKIQKKLEEIKVRSHAWMPEWNGDMGFEVKGADGSRYAVDLNSNTCGCRRWQLCGIPCVHVVAACNYMNKAPEELVHSCYTRNSYLLTYNNVMMPLQGKDLWPKSDKPKVIPPLVPKQVGRPKRARRREPDERQEKIQKEIKRKQVQKASRKGLVIIKCSTCGQAGHNRRSHMVENVSRPRKKNKLDAQSQPTSVDDVTDAPMAFQTIPESCYVPEPIQDNTEDEAMWKEIEQSDELWGLQSQFQLGDDENASLQIPPPTKIAQKQQVRKSSRITNSPSKGPMKVYHVDPTSKEGGENETSHDCGGTFMIQASTQQSETAPQQVQNALHAGIINPPQPPLPRGQFLRQGKMYVTLEALKRNKACGTNRK